MADVFISSVQAGFEDVRAAAKEGIDTYGHRVVMAETLGAAAASPQRALLDRVSAADIYLLLVGPRYGGVADERAERDRRGVRGSAPAGQADPRPPPGR